MPCRRSPWQAEREEVEERDLVGRQLLEEPDQDVLELAEHVVNRLGQAACQTTDLLFEVLLEGTEVLLVLRDERIEDVVELVEEIEHPIWIY
jgi:hypothetical protein